MDTLSALILGRNLPLSMRIRETETRLQGIGQPSPGQGDPGLAAPLQAPVEVPRRGERGALPRGLPPALTLPGHQRGSRHPAAAVRFCHAPGNTG